MAADPIFIDTNVLVFATIPASPFHQRAIAALHGIAMSGAAAWISRQVLREYLVQLTRPGVLPVPKRDILQINSGPNSFTCPDSFVQQMSSSVPPYGTTRLPSGQVQVWILTRPFLWMNW